MRFEPDIVVIDAESGRPTVVIEAKAKGSASELGTEQLRRYMRAGACPVGLLVTATRVLVFSDDTRFGPLESIRLVGDFELRLPFPLREGVFFEAAVQRWLERLRLSEVRAQLDPGLRGVLDRYVVPALLTGEVRAAGPRWVAADAL